MAKKEPIYPHIPKSRIPVESTQQHTGDAVAADKALTLAKWLKRRRETVAGTEITEFENLAVNLEGAGLPSLANKAREIREKELEVVKGLTNIAQEVRRTFPGLR